MRTEVKIGIAVGGIIAVVAVLYFVLFQQGLEPSDQNQKATNARPATIKPGEMPKPRTSGDTLVPTIGGSPPAAAEAPATATEKPSPLGGSDKAGLPSDTITPKVAEPAPAPIQPASIPPKAGNATTRPAGTKEEPVLPDSNGGTYVVKKGDTGFWLVAERAYGPGKGKYWPLIAKANPNVDTNRLREGMTLVVPPLPEKNAGAAETPAAPIQANEPVLAAGERYCTVQPNDGWWSIAYREYGEGNYWTEIKKANPGIETPKPGMKLKLPAIKGVGASVGGGPSTRPAAKPANKPSATPKPAPPATNNDRPIFD